MKVSFKNGTLITGQPVRLLTREQALEYETGATSFIQSLIGRWFPEYFLRRARRRYDRYVAFKMYKAEMDQQLATFLANSPHCKK